MADAVISLFMLAGLGLTGGAVWLWRHGERRKPVLMAAAALLMFGNAALWLTPTEDGRSLANPEVASPQAR